MQLNTEQQHAIEHTGSPLIIYAGPGTGKTLVLEKKYEHLVKKGIPAINILGITFTRNAAAELSNRISRQTSVNRDLIIIRTFHSLCLNMLKRYTEEAGLIPGFGIAEPTEQDRLIIDCLQEQGLPFTQNHVIYIKQILSRTKKEQQNASPKTYLEEYARIIYPRYEEKLHEQNKIDYDDIIRRALRILNVPNILAHYKQIHNYIMLDEAQDTTTPQARIIYKLDCANTTIVGDQNQSIYSFAGANPNFMKEFEEKTKGTVIHLKQNYRNPENIIKAATTVIRHNENYIESQLEANKESQKQIAILETANQDTEATLIANAITNNNLDKVTILYRRNESARPIELALQRNGIPYEINGIHFYNRQEIKNIIAAIRLIENPEHRTHFRDVLKTHKGIGTKTIERIINYADETYTSLLESGQYMLAKFTHEQHQNLKRICESIKDARNLPKTKLIEKIIKDIIPKPRNSIESENIKAFETLLKNSNEPLDKLLKYVDETHTNPYVRLMTLHAAKGTENSIIFIIGAEEGLIPDENAYISRETIEEERRLFYVGLTRSEETLVISTAKSRYINGFNLNQRPSRFLREIPDKEYL